MGASPASTRETLQEQILYSVGYLLFKKGEKFGGENTLLFVLSFKKTDFLVPQRNE